MNLPNALTLSRLAAIPFVMALLLVRFEGHDQLAAALFILFSLTDTADGQIARRRRMVSDLGKFLDPLADKLYVLSVLIVLVQEGLVAAWVVVVIFARELVITLLRSVGMRQGLVIAAAPLGKTKTILQMSAVVFLILQRPYPFLVPIAAIVLAFAVLLTLVSGIEYLWRLRRLIGPARRAASPADPLAVELGGLLARNHTCIAGPDADRSDKPVGLTYIAVATAGGARCDEHLFQGDRWSNRREAAALALRLVI